MAAGGSYLPTGRHRGRPLPGPPAGLPVRVLTADLTITPAGGKPRTERCRLITTLADWRAAPAAGLAACYAQRREIENGYREIGAFTRRPGQVLRSQTPAGTPPGNLGPALRACPSSAAPPAPAPPQPAATTPTGSPAPSPCAAIVTPAPPGQTSPPKHSTPAPAPPPPRLPPPDPARQHRQTPRRPGRPHRHHHLQDHHRAPRPGHRPTRPLNQRHCVITTPIARSPEARPGTRRRVR